MFLVDNFNRKFCSSERTNLGIFYPWRVATGVTENDMADLHTVDKEIQLLVQEIQRLGKPNPDYQDKVTVKYGVLFRDNKCQQIFEAILGTLKAAKKRKVLDFKGEILLQGAHDNVDIVLLKSD
jgi:hypothetical protein